LKNFEENLIVELIQIFYINTDQDGSLKFTQIDKFRDAKTFAVAMQELETMVANK
jgi:hypothetical protein